MIEGSRFLRSGRSAILGTAAITLLSSALIAPNSSAASGLAVQHAPGHVARTSPETATQTTVRKRPRTRIVRVSNARGRKQVSRIGPWKRGKPFSARIRESASYPNVAAALGKPYRLRSREKWGLVIWTATYRGRYAGKFYFMNLGGQPGLKHQWLQKATLTGKGWRTARGVGPGSSVKRLKARHPKAVLGRGGAFKFYWFQSQTSGKIPLMKAKIRKGTGTVDKLLVYVGAAGI